jgi:hypothetical protein
VITLIAGAFNIYTKSYFGQECYYLSKITQGIRTFSTGCLVPGKEF